VDVQVVHDDHITFAEPGHELLPHEPQEGPAIDGATLGHQSRALAEPDGSDERQRLPVPPRSAADRSLAAPSPPVAAAHSRLAEGL
jgi:hypothetical protein